MCLRENDTPCAWARGTYSIFLHGTDSSLYRNYLRWNSIVQLNLKTCWVLKRVTDGLWINKTFYSIDCIQQNNFPVIFNNLLLLFTPRYERFLCIDIPILSSMRIKCLYFSYLFSKHPNIQVVWDLFFKWLEYLNTYVSVETQALYYFL